MNWLASPRVTVAVFVALALAALAVKDGLLTPTAAMLPVLALFVTNLVAALLVHPRFKTDTALLVFHVALLALVSCFAVGRLTYLYGSVSLVKDMPFDGTIDLVDQGPQHRGNVRALSFEHAGQVERFNDDTGHKLDLRTRLRYQDDSGVRQIELAFGYPLLLGGYRIYPSGRRGYAPIFSWDDGRGAVQTGSVQLFGPGDRGLENTNEWNLPGGTKVWVQLVSGAEWPPKKDTVRVDLGADRLPHHLILRVGDDLRHTIRMGDTLSLPGGRLTYLSLSTWGGYSLIYDPTEPYLFACVLIAAISLGWYYLLRFRHRKGGE
jgi:hypothetical protein